MIAALEALKRNYGQLGDTESSLSAMQISSKRVLWSFFQAILLEKRIQALKVISLEKFLFKN